MHAAITSMRREPPSHLLAVVPASAPRYEENYVAENEKTHQKENLLDLPLPGKLATKAMALDVLTATLGGSHGSDEIQKREKGAYVAATQALNEDKGTRKLRVYMNHQILPRLQGKLRTASIKYRLWLTVEIIAALLSITVFGVMATTEMEKTVDDWLKEKFGIRMGMSIVSMLATVLLLISSRMAGGLRESMKRLKREVEKRKTYNYVSEEMAYETETHGREMETRLSSSKYPVWFDATGKAATAGGWQLMQV
uniref:NS3 n=1 Tax=Middle Point orbivirus TaxID=464979 RepID=A0A8K1I3A4_9REOV|nr:NS3 [Middle Point orbivirus]